MRHKLEKNGTTFSFYFTGKEGLDMSDPTRTEMTDPSNELTEVNKFPGSFTDEMRQTFEEYFTELHKLGKTLVRSVFQIYGADTTMVGTPTLSTQTKTAQGLMGSKVQHLVGHLISPIRFL